MKNKECDIIKDLLPSYVDNICSEASVEWIEAHFKECGECRALAETMKNTEVSAKGLVAAELDAAKKIAKQNLRRSILSLGLSVLMFVVLLCGFFWDNGQIPVLLLPICMAMTWLVCKSQRKVRSRNRVDIGFAVAAAVFTGYGIGMMFYGYSAIASGTTMFGVQHVKSGPLMQSQVVLACVVCAVLYFAQILRTLLKGRAGSVVQNVCLTGIFLMLSYCMQLGQLSDIIMAKENLRTLTLLVLVIGAVGTGVFALLDKCSKK